MKKKSEKDLSCFLFTLFMLGFVYFLRRKISPDATRKHNDFDPSSSTHSSTYSNHMELLHIVVIWSCLLLPLFPHGSLVVFTSPSLQSDCKFCGRTAYFSVLFEYYFSQCHSSIFSPTFPCSV